jgi:hypothetical protein
MELNMDKPEMTAVKKRANEVAGQVVLLEIKQVGLQRAYVKEQKALMREMEKRTKAINARRLSPAAKRRFRCDLDAADRLMDTHNLALALAKINGQLAGAREELRQVAKIIVVKFRVEELSAAFHALKTALA